VNDAVRDGLPQRKPADGAPHRLERMIGLVLRAGVTLSSICLGAGLVLSLFPASAAAAEVLLHIGVIVLLATPVVRVLVSVAEYAIVRDWAFVTLTVVVLIELMASAVAALVFNRKL
jgi:uncharacterized membrane protein